MDQARLPLIYSDYIACLNERDWTKLGEFVDSDVVHNGLKLGLAGYRGMLERNVRDIPDLRFETELLVVQPPQIGSRLKFDCRPIRWFFDLPINGRRVIFYENVFYRFDRGRIVQVWSIVDKAAIEAQLGA
ncbi:ester cyclase [Bosea sp. 117]|uniref:ester cyclase n=1 Tax=Bosea sp. 117 TaxID=1125973 RepID=UPI0004949841|nr:ester cyclase [Bosea sp. 117]